MKNFRHFFIKGLAIALFLVQSCLASFVQELELQLNEVVTTFDGDGSFAEKKKALDLFMKWAIGEIKVDLSIKKMADGDIKMWLLSPLENYLKILSSLSDYDDKQFKASLVLFHEIEDILQGKITTTITKYVVEAIGGSTKSEDEELPPFLPKLIERLQGLIRTFRDIKNISLSTKMQESWLLECKNFIETIKAYEAAALGEKKLVEETVNELQKELEIKLEEVKKLIKE